MALGSSLVSLSVVGVLLSVASSPDQPAPRADCVAEARALTEKVLEFEGPKKQARMIELAVRRDVSIVCGVISQSFFTSELESPKGCDAKQSVGCPGLRVIPLSRELARIVDPVIYLRIQTIALELQKKKLLSDEHRKLLTIWLNAQAKSAQADKEHGH